MADDILEEGLAEIARRFAPRSVAAAAEQAADRLHHRAVMEKPRPGLAHAADRLKPDAERARPPADDSALVRLAQRAAAPAPDQGVKHDAGKLRLDLLPTDALEAVARILTLGAAKYGERNWEAGMSWRRVDAALERHLFAWRRGEERDAESGEPHLAHAACCVLFLLAYAGRGVGLDDRPAAERRRAPC